MTETSHKEISLETIDTVLSFIKTQLNQLSDGDIRQEFSKILESLKTAEEMATDNKRKTCLYDAATKYANQLAFRLFVEGNLNDSALTEFRGFETVKQVAEYAQTYTDEDRARADEITAAQRAFMDERQPFEVFQAVINGMTKEEAEQKQAEFQQRQQEALHR